MKNLLLWNNLKLSTTRSETNVKWSTYSWCINMRVKWQHTHGVFQKLLIVGTNINHHRKNLRIYKVNDRWSKSHSRSNNEKGIKKGAYQILSFLFFSSFFLIFFFSAKVITQKISTSIKVPVIFISFSWNLINNDRYGVPYRNKSSPRDKCK